MSQARPNMSAKLYDAAGTGDLETVIAACNDKETNINYTVTVTLSLFAKDGLFDGLCRHLNRTVTVNITPIVAAFLKGHYEIVKELIERGAELEGYVNKAAPNLTPLYLYHVILTNKVEIPTNLLGMILGKIKKPSRLFVKAVNTINMNPFVRNAMFFENLLCGETEGFNDSFPISTSAMLVKYLTEFLFYRSFTCTSAFKALTAFEKIYRKGLLTITDYLSISKIVYEKTKVDLLKEELPIEFCITMLNQQTIRKLEDICYELNTWLLPGSDRAVAGIKATELNISRSNPVKMRDLLNMDETELVKRLYAVTSDVKCNMINNPAVLLLASLVVNYNDALIEEEDKSQTPLFTGALKIKVISVMKSYFGLTHDQKVQLASLLASEKVAANLELENRPGKQSVIEKEKDETQESDGQKFKVFRRQTGSY